jgi:outer membrane immunogenic protein
MKRRALGSALILAFSMIAAMAADVAVPVSPAPAPPPYWPRSWDWNGFYGGINAGYSFGNARNAWNIIALAVTTPVGASIPNSGTIAIPHSFRLEWVGTVRGRLGFVWGPVLVYGTGGFAWATTKQQDGSRDEDE